LLIAEVYANIPVKRVAEAYSYLVPEEMSFLAPGWRVLVPFGARLVEGFVRCCYGVEDSKVGLQLEELKFVAEALDEDPWFTPRMLDTTNRLADFYLATPAEIMRLFVPGKSTCKIRNVYRLKNGTGKDGRQLSLAEQSLVDYLGTHPDCTEQQLKQALPEVAKDIPKRLQFLKRHGYLKSSFVAVKRAKPVVEKYVELLVNITPELMAAYKNKKAQQRALRFLADHNRIVSWKELQVQGINAAPLKALAADGIIVIKERRSLRDSYAKLEVIGKQVPLTKAQQQALTRMQPYLTEHREKRFFLLYGVTGSGKTRVYMEAVAEVRRQGRQAVVLVPEIALTGQLVQAFKSYLPQDIIVIHSRLTVAERNDAMLRLRLGEAGIVIGARSALFAPLTDIGIIVIDEEQDMSYKQDELPRYHGKVVAEILAQVHQAVLLLGSATPSLESYYQAQQGEVELLEMPDRIGGRPLPDVQCVDMRQELKLGNRTVLSHQLHELLEETRGRQEQSILMLNRRGYSTFVMCRSCGKVLVCPECKLPMVYHWDGRLVCHHCDIRQDVPQLCPACGSRYIKYFGSGTEKLEEELRATHPEARVIRMDRDTTRGKFAHTEIIKAFREKQYDILLGTQMVAKGHDIANVTAVGILSADSSLNMPDFRAAERCFMLITQTAGRAGRGQVPGQVIVQS